MKRLLVVLAAAASLVAPASAFAGSQLYLSAFMNAGQSNGGQSQCNYCVLNRAYIAFDSHPGENTPYHVALKAGGSFDPVGAHISGVNDVQWGRSGTPYNRLATCWIPTPYPGEYTNCRKEYWD